MVESEDISAALATIDALQQKLSELRRSIYRDIRSVELPGGHGDLLSCRVGASLVALPLERVESVVQRCALTPVPEAPGWVAGLLDFRGTVLPVIDLHARLHGAPAATALTDVLLVCREDSRRVAFLAQEIGDVHLGATLDGGEDVHEVPHGPYVMAIARLAAGPAVVLSLARLLAALELPAEAAA